MLAKRNMNFLSKIWENKIIHVASSIMSILLFFKTALAIQINYLE